MAQMSGKNLWVAASDGDIERVKVSSHEFLTSQFIC